MVSQNDGNYDDKEPCFLYDIEKHLLNLIVTAGDYGSKELIISPMSSKTVARKVIQETKQSYFFIANKTDTKKQKLQQWWLNNTTWENQYDIQSAEWTDWFDTVST
jgi:hypothetical protein